jgi:tRNA threonylcarbamoyladenosine biosynthesis protein TsaE
MSPRRSLDIFLTDTAQTLRLGRIIATCLLETSPHRAVLLQGDLGAGKTTLVRGLVEALPGGSEAEVSSPSFNLVNLYPTQPETAHFDLYRLEGQEPDESLLELLESRAHLVLVEWVQYLPAEHWPGQGLLLRLRAERDGRRVELTPLDEDPALPGCLARALDDWT